MRYTPGYKEDMNEINDTAIEKTPAEMLKIMILEARYNVREAQEYYLVRKQKGLDTMNALITLKGRIGSLIFELKSMMKRTYKREPQIYQEIIRKSTSDKAEEVLEVVDILNDLLDAKNLVRIDRDVYDYTNAAMEDKMKGYD